MFELTESWAGRMWRSVGIGCGVLVGGLAALETIRRYLGERGIWLVFAAVIVASWVWAWLVDRARGQEFRDFVRRRGFTDCAGVLPRSFPIQRVQGERWRSVVRSAIGKVGRVEVLIFDCTVKRGRASFARTVLAIRQRREEIWPGCFEVDLQVDESAGWTVLSTERGFLAARAMEAALEEIGDKQVD